MKRVLITGAGTGFGHEAAMRLAEKGFDVIATVEIWAQVQTLKRQAAARGVTLERLSAWLRKHGVTARKPIHELRKEFGSMINRKHGLSAASDQLRHSVLLLRQRAILTGHGKRPPAWAHCSSKASLRK